MSARMAPTTRERSRAGFCGGLVGPDSMVELRPRKAARPAREETIRRWDGRLESQPILQAGTKRPRNDEVPAENTERRWVFYGHEYHAFTVPPRTQAEVDERDDILTRSQTRRPVLDSGAAFGRSTSILGRMQLNATQRVADEVADAPAPAPAPAPARGRSKSAASGDGGGAAMQSVLRGFAPERAAERTTTTSMRIDERGYMVTEPRFTGGPTREELRWTGGSSDLPGPNTRPAWVLDNQARAWSEKYDTSVLTIIVLMSDETARAAHKKYHGSFNDFYEPNHMPVLRDLLRSGNRCARILLPWETFQCWVGAISPRPGPATLQPQFFYELLRDAGYPDVLCGIAGNVGVFDRPNGPTNRALLKFATGYTQGSFNVYNLLGHRVPGTFVDAPKPRKSGAPAPAPAAAAPAAPAPAAASPAAAPFPKRLRVPKKPELIAKTHTEPLAGYLQPAFHPFTPAELQQARSIYIGGAGREGIPTDVSTVVSIMNDLVDKCCKQYRVIGNPENFWLTNLEAEMMQREIKVPVRFKPDSSTWMHTIVKLAMENGLNVLAEIATARNLVVDRVELLAYNKLRAGNRAAVAKSEARLKSWEAKHGNAQEEKDKAELADALAAHRKQLKEIKERHARRDKEVEKVKMTQGNIGWQNPFGREALGQIVEAIRKAQKSEEFAKGSVDHVVCEWQRCKVLVDAESAIATTSQHRVWKFVDAVTRNQDWLKNEIKFTADEETDIVQTRTALQKCSPAAKLTLETPNDEYVTLMDETQKLLDACVARKKQFDELREAGKARLKTLDNLSTEETQYVNRIEKERDTCNAAISRLTSRANDDVELVGEQTRKQKNGNIQVVELD